LPAEIWTLTGLENLYVYENGLESIPAGIGNLTNLVEFDASYNYLDSLPEEIRTLTGLESLYVYGDRLESIPAEIGNLVNLTELDL
jgi:Leucine-rich repeat (LRR) protein